ncbi:MAG: SDR family oxidoreductase [Candidatus Azobacteroides sp.]|nr:SDR family oxidoreductase [Candidatus Azobacteroides sp.]
MEKGKHVKLSHPQKKFYHHRLPKQKQEAPGLQTEMELTPDSGEKTYVGHNRLQGRKAFITGGDSGIGRAVAIAYAREGAQVAINYLPQEQKDADSLAEVLKKDGVDLIMLPGDIRHEDVCIRLVKEAHEKMNGLDILVLNAAVQVAQTDIQNLTADQIRNTFEVNVFSGMYITKAAIPLLPEGSSIIFTGSAEYYTPNKMLLDYAASKSAVVAFSIALSKQVIGKGIRVNTICPGPIWTPLEISGGNPDEGIPVHGLDTPMKRPGQPVEMAGLYVFLASEESSYAMGEVYGLTGGLSSH